VSAGLAIQMARELNTSMDNDAAEELAELCNCDLGAMRSEIDKLATYAGAGRPIQRADIEELVVSERKYSVWELAEVLAMRQRSRAFHFLTNVLNQGEAAPALIGTMAWMFRKLIEAQGLSPRPRKATCAGWECERRPPAWRCNTPRKYRGGSSYKVCGHFTMRTAG
jgi:DNA polymerase III delta subunit